MRRGARAAPEEPSLEPPDTSSLLYHCRTKILDQILHPLSGIDQGVDRQNVLILDDMTIRIVSESCKTHELTTKHVLLVEKVSNPREALPAFDAIYFITPESIDLVIRDFPNPPAVAPGKKAPPATRGKYNNVHIFLTTGLVPSLAAKIRQAPGLSSRVKTLTEIGLDFYVEEKAVYSTNQSSLFPYVFSSRAPALPPMQISEAYASMALKVLSVCVSVGCDPVVRCMATQPNMPNPSMEVARRMKMFMNTYKERHNYRETPGPKYTLLILDRSVDMLSPILHDFSYRSLVYEFHDIQGRHLSTKFRNESGEHDRDVFLNDDDPVWVKYRHMFFSEAIQQIRGEMNDFRANHPGAQCFADGHVSDKAPSLGVAIQSLPDFTRRNERYGAHVGMGEKIFSEIDRRQLGEIAQLEQDMAFNMCTGGKVRGHISRLTRFLQDPTLIKEDKIRLLMVTLMTTDGIRPDEFQQYCQQARLTPDERKPLEALRLFGIEPDGGVAGRKKKNRQRDRMMQTRETYPQMQYLPILDDIIRDHLEGRLSDAAFPVVSDAGGSGDSTPDPMPSPTPAAAAPPSRAGGRGFSANWNKGGAAKPARGAAGAAGGAGAKPLIIYIVGGITSEEMRAVTTIRNEKSAGGRNPPTIFLGGTEVLLAKTMLDHLRHCEWE